MWKRIFIVFGVVTWFVFLCLVIQSYWITTNPFLTHTYDVSRRVTSPDGKRIVLLVREYGFDLNFSLYIVDNPTDSVPKDYTKTIWLSHDYNTDSRINWHEDLQWKKDSSVVAVIIDGKYVFAYDFNTGENVEDEETIKQFLMLWHQP